MCPRILTILSLLMAFAIPSRAALTIETRSPLYNGSLSDTYNLQFLATGGTPPYTWSVASGKLPQGILLNALNTPGLLSGTPTAAGTSTFKIRVADSAGSKQTQTFSLSVLTADNRYCNAGNVVNFAGATTDGPALLPKSCYFTLRSATPSLGATCAAHTSSDLTNILNGSLLCSDNHALACGDTIQLDAGASYATSIAFTFPKLGCDDNHYITVESTGVKDSRWPAEGTRISPCYADVASLPGRPAFPCPTGGPVALMAQLLFTSTASNSSGPVNLSTNNADHYRFIGVEITRQTAPKTTIGDLVTMGMGHHVVLDQVWCHGVEPAGAGFPETKTNYTETRRCLGLGQSNHVAVINSYLNDFYCTQTAGTGCDAQAVFAGVGTVANSGWGTYKIENNFLEGAAETIETGGGNGPNTNGTIDAPVDFEVRRNHMFKPMSWMPTAKTTTGWPVVKNHFEQKSGVRTLVEGNLMENVWAGFTQIGAIVLMTPKNANQGTQNLCPSCAVTDLTFRYNSGTQGATAFYIANKPNTNGVFALGGEAYSVHDNVMDNLAYQPCFSCNAQLDPLFVFEDLAVPAKEILHDVSFNHNTIVQAAVSQKNQKALLDISGAPSTGNEMFNITFTNNLGEAGLSGTLTALSAKTAANCTFKQKGGAPMIEACWNPFVFGGNAIVANKATWPVMPLSNTPNCLSEASYDTIFVNYNNGSGGDYHVVASSLCHDGSTDGTDPGANIDLLASYTTSVR